MASPVYVNDIAESNVGYSGAGWVDGENILTAQFNRSFETGDAVKADWDAYMAEMKVALMSIALPEGFNEAFDNFVVSDVSGIDATSISAPNAPVLPGFEDVYFPLLPALKPIPITDLSYTDPTAPNDVNVVLGYMGKVYTSDMWLTLFTKIQDGVTSGADGFGAAVEALIYIRDQERERPALEQAYLTGTKAIAMRGLPVPHLALRSLEQRAGMELARIRVNSSNNIAISQAELVSTNTRFLIEQAGNFEKASQDFHINEERLSLEAKQAAAKLMLENYAEANRAFVAKYEGFKIKGDIERMKLDAAIAEDTLIGTMYKIGTDAAIAKTEQIAKERGSLTDAYKTDGDVYDAKVRAQAAWYNAQTENTKAQLQRDELRLNAIVNKLKMTIDSEISINSLKERFLEAMTHAASQVLASVYNTVNTSVGHSTGSSRSVSESYGHSEHLGESYNTEIAAV